MKQFLTLILLCGAFQFYGQNWIGNENFLGLYDRSDVVLIGDISKIDKLKQDSIRISPFNMPLKRLELTSVKTIKGNKPQHIIYYTDIFNGCGYAPILVENKIKRRTLIFAKIKNDSLFQIGSMNESSDEIGKTIIDFEKIRSNITSQNFTNWFYNAGINKDLFELLNNSITFKRDPLFSQLHLLNFSAEQRDQLYNVLQRFENYDHDNQGMVSILVKYKDKRLKSILKKFFLQLREDPYSEINDLMEDYYRLTGNEAFKKLIDKFKEDSRRKQRLLVINDFIARM